MAALRCVSLSKRRCVRSRGLMWEYQVLETSSTDSRRLEPVSEGEENG